ncbi:MAG: MFS transporter [Litorilinea sp.]
MANPLAHAQGLRGARALLSIADFRWLLSSNVLWWQAHFMEAIVVGWLVLEMTNSPWLVAVAGFCRSLPLLILGFVAGQVADRFGRRRVILAAQSTNFTVQVTLVILLLTDSLQLWHLYATGVILGACWAMDWPARRSLLPDLVGKERTVDAMLLENLSQGFSRIGGPAIAGVLVAAYGAIGAYLVMMLLSGATLTTLSYLSGQPIPKTNRRAAASPWSVLGESLRYVGKNQPILGVILITAAFNMWVVPYMTLLPVIARDVLRVGPAGLGYLGAASGVGSFFGLLLIAQIRRHFSNGWIMLVGTIGMSIVLFGLSQSTWYPLSWGLLFMAGMGQACFGIMQTSIILLTASDEMRSRTMGVLVLAIGSDPLGKLQTGALAQVLGAATALSVMTGAAALALVGIGIALPGLRAMPAPATQQVPPLVPPIGPAAQTPTGVPQSTHTPSQPGGN